MSLVYRIIESPVGRLKLVAGAAGLKAVTWESEGAERVRLDAMHVDETHPTLHAAQQQLAEYFAGQRKHFELLLDPRGTVFQQAVWRALLAIPYGETRSYRDIARQIGRPEAVRAVGAANARNPLCIVVPCHRVIGSSGAMTGFAGGLQAKSHLLALESNATARAGTGVVMGEDGLARPPWAAVDPLLRHYYDTEWGMPVRDERGLFERLSLECFQSGLSWATILRKREAFRAAFNQFDPDVVAAYDEADVERLMADAGIVRNRAKILATINNAAATLALRAHGGLVNFIWSFQPAQTPTPRSIDEIPTVSEASTALSKALRARGFKFVGPTTMHALMEATGMIDTHLMDSHRRGSSGIWPA
ncbi:methylated-DNA--[protein]-cysteine S-methyltransferase [Bordetella sp. 02P26C-1]|uniref:methylated-DNA--[protein]-cysteine S-methyltransferase n=1 Tax=Bordetella sp. 02P26C-1 TaxID=2683195 RepID=UPI001354D5CD|nr:methylated-DNA--[protein]-cysteine S-methyltransferase [Bordetella sp. 02P26C-1]